MLICKINFYSFSLTWELQILNTTETVSNERKYLICPVLVIIQLNGVTVIFKKIILGTRPEGEMVYLFTLET